MNFENKVAVITGAGGGIGRALAQRLAQRGTHLALVDIDCRGLEETAASLPTGITVSQHCLDIADRESVAALPQAVLTTHKHVDLLINNAGVAVGGFFEQILEADFDWLMEINFHGLVRMTRAFLPLLRQSKEAGIVNLSSIYGLISPSGQSAYSASKFAVRGFSNALQHELQDSNIVVTVVHPGGVATSIARSARLSASLSAKEIIERRAKIEKRLRLSPESAAETIVWAIEKRKQRVIVGGDAKFASWLERIAPVRYWNILELMLRLEGGKKT